MGAILPPDVPTDLFQCLEAEKIHHFPTQMAIN
jgi:hypothetical protein